MHLTPVKLLQSRSGYSMLTKSNTEGFTIVRGQTINWLQRLENTKAECLVVAALERSGVSPAAAEFPDKLRLTCADGAGSNNRSERAIMDAPDRKDWTRVGYLIKSNNHLQIFFEPSFSLLSH